MPTEIELNAVTEEFYALTHDYFGHRLRGERSTSPRAEQIGQLIGSLGTRASPIWRRIFSLVIGEEVPAPSAEEPLPTELLRLGIVLVPVLNTNGNNYPIERPVLFMGAVPAGNSATALRVDGTYGNHVDPNLRNYRLPTKDEVRNSVRMNWRALADRLIFIPSTELAAAPPDSPPDVAPSPSEEE